ncbi:MAG TPA: hydrogenase 2 operon protein HybA [Acidobacteriaceae bacterium]
MSVLLSRRQAFKVMIGLGGIATSAMLPKPARAATEEHPDHPVAAADDVSMLFDSTVCTGCRACMPACNEANGLPADTLLSGGIWDMPTGLNSKTKNIIELYQDAQSEQFAFVKKQCMHCLDPACVTGCPFGSLKKSDWGVVTWNSSLCIGCRYCEVACPFEVPKFEWESWNPKIVKCEFCYDQRLKKDMQPACTAACPTGAVIFGKRTDLLAQAKGRIAESPDKYFEKRVYGEHEAGGTQVLYLSGVPFDKIGLPKLGPDSLGHYATKVTSKIYKWFSGPMVMAIVLGVAIRRNWNRHELERILHEKETGFPDQL